jgi:hypothetical protein
MRVEYSKRAIADIRQISAYHARSSSPAVAQRIASALTHSDGSVQFLFSSSRRRPGPKSAVGTGLHRCDKISDVGIGREGSKYSIEEFL